MLLLLYYIILKLFLGIPYSFQKKHMDHQDYKSALFKEIENTKIAKTIHFHTKHHQIYTVQREKKYLTPFNDKRYFVSPTHALSYGHKDIQKHNEE